MKPPVCHSCLYPPDERRRLLFFEQPEEMALYLSKGVDREIYPPEDKDAKPVVLECPSYNCAVGLYVDSIEDLVMKFNWFAEEIDRNHPDYQKRILAGKINSIAKILEIFINGTPVPE
ncbi:MAG: hypothetical protein N2257_02160 [Thermodesulfovibrionales bacterium]|nr:hypothetical protein [Thermodesulfovibrionales bacterium]